MILSPFITSLLKEGKVSVQTRLDPIEKQDIDEAMRILVAYYEVDITEMPFAPPAYSEEAGLWAAEYLYRAIQLTVLRDATEEMITQTLTPYPGPVNPSAIYSADLLLRYLPRLFELAKGLAPGDILVEELRKTAQQWPFSSVGIITDQPVDDAVIFTDESLKYTYIDRIIRAKDKSRIKNPEVVNCIYEVAGEHLPLFWPGFENNKTIV